MISGFGLGHNFGQISWDVDQLVINGVGSTGSDFDYYAFEKGLCLTSG